MRDRKHSEETKAKMSEAHRGKKLSEETLAKLIGKTHYEETKAKMRASALGRSFDTRVKGQAVEVLDKETNLTSTFPSISKAAEALGVTKQALSKRFGGTTNSFVLKGRYQISKITNDS